MNKKYLFIISVVAVIVIGYIISTMSRHYVPQFEYLENASGPFRQSREPPPLLNMSLPVLFGVILALLLPLVVLYSHLQVEKKLNASAELLSKLASTNHNLKVAGRNHSIGRELVARLLEPKEMAVVERLIEQPRGMLQTDVVKMPGMTKLKAHRVVERLRSKGIVTVQKDGKTNQIKLDSRTRSILSGLE
jgi:uncharacterized membrane protein